MAMRAKTLRKLVKRSRRKSSGSKSDTALLILDMLSEWKFEDAGKVLRNSRAAAHAIAHLKQRLPERMPVIYVNDTAGQWESDQQAFVSRCCGEDAKGRDISLLLAPGERDFFMFKPKHSGFYGTPLENLLQSLGVRRVILTGMTAHQCVLFTAVDAYVRDFELIVPKDCIGGGSATETRHALFILQSALKANVAASSTLRL